jgi:hypothetical protein
MTNREPLASLRGAVWAARSIRSAGRVHMSAPFPAQLPAVPALPPTARRGVEATLRVARAKCLVRAIVLQAWLLAHGDERDLVIGVTRPGDSFAAHAWLDGDEQCHPTPFHELTRHPAR